MQRPNSNSPQNPSSNDEETLEQYIARKLTAAGLAEKIQTTIQKSKDQDIVNVKSLQNLSKSELRECGFTIGIANALVNQVASPNDNNNEILSKDSQNNNPGLLAEFQKLSINQQSISQNNPALFADLLKNLNINEKQSYADPSYEILQALRAKTEHVPSLKDLPGFLTTPLPARIPLREQLYQFWNRKLEIPQHTMDSIFQSSRNEYAEDLLLSFISTSLIYPLARGETEDSWHVFWDSVITIPLQKFCTSMKFSRNSNKGTSTGSNRPDLICSVENIAVFRSEEKGPLANSNSSPEDELVNKLVWTYQGLPYILGYYAYEDNVTFVALTPGINLHKITQTFCLSQPSDRFQAFIVIRNIASILVSLANMSTVKNTISEIETIKRISGKTIQQCNEFIIKTYPITMKSTTEKLRKYYEKLVDAPFIDCLGRSKPLRENDSTIRMKFTPVGVEVKPKSSKELLIAVWCVLRAVQHLHKQNIMHRDIRWPNVLKYSNREAWFLIDLDDACEFPAPKEPSYTFHKATHAPEIFSRDFHDSAVDLWSIGHLIMECGVTTSSQIQAMQKNLSSSNPEERPSIDDCLTIICQEAEENSWELPDPVK